ncbi:MAG: hypothetical protein P8Y97_20350 [Candidatus Lokiarchaeota archaeon]
MAKNTFGIIALIFGIIGFFTIIGFLTFGISSLLAIIFCVLAIISGAIGMFKDDNKSNLYGICEL